jgi:hypothetical protein
MRFGDQVGPQEKREDVGVDLVGLDLGGGDGLEPRGVGADELTPSGASTAASQYQPPVDSTTALCGAGKSAKYCARVSGVLATRTCLTRGPSGPWVVMTESRLCWSIPEYHIGVPSWGDGSRS